MGLTKINEASFAKIDIASYDDDINVKCFFQLNQDSTLIGTNKGIYLFTKGIIEPFLNSNQYSVEDIIYWDNKLVIATAGDGLLFKKKNKLIPKTFNHSLGNISTDYFWNLDTNKAGDLLIASNGGPFRTNKTYINHPLFNMQSIATMSLSNLVYFDGVREWIFSKSVNEVLEDCHQGIEIPLLHRTEATSITSDAQGNTWISTNGQGILVYDSTYTFIDQITEEDGLYSDHNFAIHATDSFIWIGANQGLNLLHLIPYLYQDQISIDHFSTEDGFDGGQCNSNAIYQNQNGDLWFGTNKGIFKFEDKYLQNTSSILSLIIQSIDLNSEITNWSLYCDSIDNSSGLPSNLILHHNENHLTFHITGISLNSPEKVRYIHNCNR